MAEPNPTKNPLDWFARFCLVALFGAVALTIAVGFAAGSVTVRIDDDGTGIDPSAAVRASGTANLAQRAEARGGSFTLEPREPRGTTLTWIARVESTE